MKYLDKLNEFKEKKTKVFINGMPDEEGGLILEIEEDFLVFEIINNTNNEEDKTKEKINIPLSQIFSYSLGTEKIGGLNGFKTEPEEKPKEEENGTDRKEDS